jgi:hypothetical protein
VQLRFEGQTIAWLFGLFALVLYQLLALALFVKVCVVLRFGQNDLFLDSFWAGGMNQTGLESGQVCKVLRDAT